MRSPPFCSALSDARAAMTFEITCGTLRTFVGLTPGPALTGGLDLAFPKGQRRSLDRMARRPSDRLAPQTVPQLRHHRPRFPWHGRRTNRQRQGIGPPLLPLPARQIGLAARLIPIFARSPRPALVAAMTG